MSILEYASPQPSPPRWRVALFSLRFVFLTAYIGVLIGAIVVNQAWETLIPILILTLFQGLFLLGMPHLRWPRPTRRRSIIVSQMAAALAGALLTFGLFATVLSAIDKWEVGLTGKVLWMVVACAWIFWLLVFSLIWAWQPFSGFTRVYKLLIAGTILETLITIPVDIQVRKRNNCWCDQGTFWSLVITGSVALWSFGPGLVLLFLTRRLQRNGYFSLCQKCGHDLSSIQEKRCPSCNARIPRNNR
jgi:hypothetical protein